MILAEDGLAGLEKSANSILFEKANTSNYHCNTETGLIKENYELSDSLIVFEISYQANIIDIPNTIVLNKNKIYCIVSAIEFIPSESPDQLGHYKAHCRNSEKWYCYDDNSHKVTKTNIKKNMQIDILIYAKI